VDQEKYDVVGSGGKPPQALTEAGYSMEEMIGTEKLL